MLNIPFIDQLQVPRVNDFVYTLLPQYNLDQVDIIRLTRPKNADIYNGYCYFPRGKHGYKIYCRVSKKRFAEQCKINGAYYTIRMCIGIKNEIDVKFYNAEELTVYLIGHEIYHFLRHSRQIPGKNTESQANCFGITWLNLFRQMNVHTRNK